MEDRATWLERDLPHLFDDVGIDKSGYAEVVEFRDPITSVSCEESFLFFFVSLFWSRILLSTNLSSPPKKKREKNF